MHYEFYEAKGATRKGLIFRKLWKELYIIIVNNWKD